MFLELGYLLWTLVDRPAHIGPEMDSVLRAELQYDEEDQHEDEGQIGTSYREINPDYQKTYPDFDYIKSLPLQNPAVSKTYGDPNDETVLKWYLEGNKGPHESVRTSGNRTFRKATASHTAGDVASSSSPRQAEYIYSKWAARALSPYTGKSSDHYTEFRFEELSGRLLLNKRKEKKEIKEKWNTLRQTPILSNKLEFPPILIPSCGRASSGLFDLSDAMEGRSNYVEIVIIREKEESEYLRYLMSNDNIDVFVMDRSTPDTVGAARWTAKRLAENITNCGLWGKFCLVMDDNIISWKAVTLINDPYPPFEEEEPSDERSKRTDISLLRLMNYCSKENIEKHELDKFSIIGFSMGSHKNINNMRIAFGRQHLFAAIFLNMKRLNNIDYNKLAWAMEDIDFNKKTHDGRGVLVKCRRFLAQKKKLNHGGVVADLLEPFTAKKNEWKEKLLNRQFDERQEMISFHSWCLERYRTITENDTITEKLIKNINRIMIESLPFDDRISKLVELIEKIEINL